MQVTTYESGESPNYLTVCEQEVIANHQWKCDLAKLRTTIIAIGWTRGNKKALATILPTKYWEKLRTLPKFDYTEIAATHKIMKRDVGIAYIAMRKIHYNVMRFRDTVSLDEAEVLASQVDLNQLVLDIMFYMIPRN